LLLDPNNSVRNRKTMLATLATTMVAPMRLMKLR